MLSFTSSFLCFGLYHCLFNNCKPSFSEMTSYFILKVLSQSSSCLSARLSHQVYWFTFRSSPGVSKIAVKPFLNYVQNFLDPNSSTQLLIRYCVRIKNASSDIPLQGNISVSLNSDDLTIIEN